MNQLFDAQKIKEFKELAWAECRKGGMERDLYKHLEFQLKTPSELNNKTNTSREKLIFVCLSANFFDGLKFLFSNGFSFDDIRWPGTIPLHLHTNEMLDVMIDNGLFLPRSRNGGDKPLCWGFAHKPHTLLMRAITKGLPFGTDGEFYEFIDSLANINYGKYKEDKPFLKDVMDAIMKREVRDLDDRFWNECLQRDLSPLFKEILREKRAEKLKKCILDELPETAIEAHKSSKRKM